jgi:hypothetical protein
MEHQLKVLQHQIILIIKDLEILGIRYLFLIGELLMQLNHLY